jgi:electron-transferring-flavoprotein dehydrogenase
MELHAKYTLFAEGCRGHLGKQLEAKFGLREGRPTRRPTASASRNCGRSTPSSSKRAWWCTRRLADGSPTPTAAASSTTSATTWSRSASWSAWLQEPAPVALRGNAALKTHPQIAPLFKGGKRLAYGARAIAAGGLQSLPKLDFPGGALIGDDAGLLNASRIKGSHAAIKSGMLAAEAAASPRSPPAAPTTR